MLGVCSITCASLIELQKLFTVIVLGGMREELFEICMTSDDYDGAVALC